MPASGRERRLTAPIQPGPTPAVPWAFLGLGAGASVGGGSPPVAPLSVEKDRKGRSCLVPGKLSRMCGPGHRPLSIKALESLPVQRAREVLAKPPRNFCRSSQTSQGEPYLPIFSSFLSSNIWTSGRLVVINRSLEVRLCVLGSPQHPLCTCTALWDGGYRNS